MKKGIFLTLLIITVLAEVQQPRLKQKVFVFATEIPVDYSITNEITSIDKKKEENSTLPSPPSIQTRRPGPPQPIPSRRPSGEVAINRPPPQIQYVSQVKPQPQNEINNALLTPLAQEQQNKKKLQKHPQFQQFKKIEFKAARTYKVNNINDQSVLDAEGRIVPTSLLTTPSNVKYEEIIPKKQQSVISQPRPRFPPQPNLRQNIQNRQQPKTPQILIQKPQQYKQQPTIKPKIPRTGQDSAREQKNILKIIFTIMLGISALIIVFGYKPEQRNVGPYIPSGDDEQSRLR